MLATAGCRGEEPSGHRDRLVAQDPLAGVATDPPTEAMDLTSLSEFRTLSGCIFLLFFLYIVVILKHFSLCFVLVFFICYRLTSGDMHLV